MNLIHTLNWTIIIPLIFLSLIVYIKNRKSLENKIFSLFIISVLIWTITNYISDISKDYQQALLWSRLTILGPALMPVLFLHFTFLYPIKKTVKKITLIILYSIPSIFILLSLTKFNIEAIKIHDWGVEVTKIGILYYFLFIYIITYFVWSITNLIIFYLKVDNTKKLQVIYIIVGFIIAACFGLFTNLILLFLGINRYTAFGPLSGLIFTIFVSISIIRHRLMGINFVASRIYIYLALSGFAYMFFYVVSIFEIALWDSVFHIKALSFGIIISIIFALIYVPFAEKIKESSDLFFFRGNNPKKVIKKLLLKLNKTVDLKEIYKTLDKTLGDVIQVKDISILSIERDLEKRKKKKISVQCSYNCKTKHIHEETALFKSLKKEQKIVIKDELDAEDEKSKKLKEEMEEFSVHAAVPLIHGSRLVSFIALGEKNSKASFTQEDYNFLETLKDQGSIAVDNALLYKKVQGFNRTLKRKVNEQTKELKKKNTNLKKLLKMREEFLTIASHQLRTPMTVIKGMSDMLLSNKLSYKKKQKFIEGISTKAQKLSDIIHDILNALEMESNSFELKLKPAEVLKIINYVVKIKQKTAQEKGLSIEIKSNKEEVFALTNCHYLEQALIYLINNAINYTVNGKITVKVTEWRQFVLIKIIDTGIGISKEEQAHIFDKFKRGSNAPKVYTDGSGLGLFIVKRIMEAHNHRAKVYIEKSEVGKGTTMTLRLPKANNNQKKKKKN
jgi:signal transduction histidine kinase